MHVLFEISMFMNCFLQSYCGFPDYFCYSFSYLKKNQHIQMVQFYMSYVLSLKIFSFHFEARQSAIILLICKIFQSQLCIIQIYIDQSQCENCLMCVSITLSSICTQVQRLTDDLNNISSIVVSIMKSFKSRNHGMLTFAVLLVKLQSFY